MRIFDTHAHYDSRQFKEDREEILRYLHEEQDISVGRIVNNGADMASSYTSLKLAEEHDFIYAAVGVHPDSAGELIFSPEGYEVYEDEEDSGTNADTGSNNKKETTEQAAGNESVKRKIIPEEVCRKNREELRLLTENRKVVAVGEIGLDYHWDVWPREIQQEAFRWQWKLAEETGLPVIIHSRDAAEDTLKMVQGFYGDRTPGKCSSVDNRHVKAVMHCYSYSVEHAEEYLKLGLMFGIGGVVTFKNAKKLKEVVDMLPLEHIMLETDCPYMAPDPFRGKRNHSGYLTYVAEKIAEIKGVDVKKVYDVTWDNAVRFFMQDMDDQDIIQEG